MGRITVDTTVQPKAVTHPSDAKLLLLTAITQLGALAKRQGVRLRQSYARVGRLVRDIERKIAGDAALEAAFAKPLGKARRIRAQRQQRRGSKLYSCHAPEVECIGKGKAHKP